MKNKKLLIYHGSISIMEKPIFGFGKIHNDYGLGFYCTKSLELAKEWAVTDKNDGYANKYVLDTTGLKILDLTKTGNVLHWITVLVKNRVFGINSQIALAAKDYLIKHFSLPVEEYDVIKGYRADDSYFQYARSFLNNTISVRTLKEALKLGNLGEQIVLISEKAFSHISFLGYEEAKSAKYYPLRAERNEKANKAYSKCLSLRYKEEDIFIRDIMKGMREDDLRL